MELHADAALAGLRKTIAGTCAQIRQAIGTVDFWRNTYAQDRLRLQITNYLDDHDLVSLDRQQPVADRLVELARTLHARLVT